MIHQGWQETPQGSELFAHVGRLQSVRATGILGTIEWTIVRLQYLCVTTNKHLVVPATSHVQELKKNK